MMLCEDALRLVQDALNKGHEMRRQQKRYFATRTPAALTDAKNAERRFDAALVEAELHALDTCNAICLLPGWEKSVGAKRELARALQLGLTICVVAITTSDQIVEIMRRAAK